MVPASRSHFAACSKFSYLGSGTRHFDPRAEVLELYSSQENCDTWSGTVSSEILYAASLKETLARRETLLPGAPVKCVEMWQASPSTWMIEADLLQAWFVSQILKHSTQPCVSNIFPPITTDFFLLGFVAALIFSSTMDENRTIRSTSSLPMMDSPWRTGWGCCIWNRWIPLMLSPRFQPGLGILQWQTQHLQRWE